MEPGLQEISLPPIPPAPPKITVDGKLDEWKGLIGCDYNPLDRLVKSVDDPAIAAILADPISVNFKTCYDTDALYVAVDWHDRKPGQTLPRRVMPLTGRTGAKVLSCIS